MIFFNKNSQKIKQLEKALAESEERLSLLANLSYDVLWEWDIVGGYHKWIGDIDSCLGYERNEFPRTIEAWENTIHPDDRDRVVKKLKEHHEKHVKWSQIYRVIKKNGEIRWWDDRGVTSWSEDGVPLVMTGVILDITEKLLHEKKISELEKKVTLTKFKVNFSICLINCQSVFIYRKMTTLSPLLIKCSKIGLGIQKRASVMS